MATLEALFPELRQSCGFIVFLDPDRGDVWLNPDALHRNHLDDLAGCKELVTSIIIGGSSGVSGAMMAAAAKMLKGKGFPHSKLGIIPAHHDAFTSEVAYAAIPLLLNATNPYYKFDFVVRSVSNINACGLTPVPTAYLLIEPADKTTVGRVTQPAIIRRDDWPCLESYLQAATMMGVRTVSLEAGSGAEPPLNPELVAFCRRAYDGMITVGGGIRSAPHAQELADAGADVIIIGDAIEKSAHPGRFITSVYDALRAIERVGTGAYSKTQRNPGFRKE